MTLGKGPNPPVGVVLGLMAALALGACSGRTDQSAEWRLRSFGRPAQAGETPLAFRTRRAMEQIVQAQLRQPHLRRRGPSVWLRRLPLVRRLQRNPLDLQDWNHGYLYLGLIAFARRSGEAAPADLVAAIGRENGWEIGEAPWRSFDHPDDFAVGAAYVALEPIRPEKAMLDPLRRRAGRVIAAGQPSERWWIDAIAMAPPLGWPSPVAIRSRPCCGWRRSEVWRPPDFSTAPASGFSSAISTPGSVPSMGRVRLCSGGAAMAGPWRAWPGFWRPYRLTTRPANPWSVSTARPWSP